MPGPWCSHWKCCSCAKLQNLSRLSLLHIIEVRASQTLCIVSWLEQLRSVWGQKERWQQEHSGEPGRNMFAISSSMQFSRMALATAGNYPRDRVLANSCIWGLLSSCWVSLGDLGNSEPVELVLLILHLPGQLAEIRPHWVWYYLQNWHCLSVGHVCKAGFYPKPLSLLPTCTCWLTTTMASIFEWLVFFSES